MCRLLDVRFGAGECLSGRLLGVGEGAHNASFRINRTRKSVDRNDMIRSFVPGTIFPPVRGGNFFPRVIESAVKGIDPHGLHSKK